MKNNEQCINSIFETEWWLNAVAEDSWEYIEVIKNNGDISARFPIYKSKYLGKKTLGVPALTQTLGIYLEETGAKISKKLEKNKKLINEIIQQLPPQYSCNFYLDINNDYVLPFIWAGFKVEAMFSYRLENLNDLDLVWKGFKENIRTDIRKAEKNVFVKEEDNIEVLIEMQKKTFLRQGRSFPLDENIIRRIDSAAGERHSKLLLCARDSEQRVHAAAYYVFDDNRCYYLMSGGDPLYRNSGATSLLLWEGIKKASERVDIFDFEGSMIEDIERFVRGFGAIQRNYYRVKKLNCMQSIAEYFKPRIKQILHYK